jgi:predicted dehydrogenase
MLEACRSNGVLFMDGVMFMHSKRLPLLRRVLDDGESIGRLRRIASQFTFAAPDVDAFMRGNIRTNAELEPLGCLGDLGWYNLRFTLWVMNYQMPERVSGRNLAEQGSAGGPVPTEFSGELLFPSGVSATFYCSFQTENQQWAHVSGTRGSLLVPDFVLPFYGPEAGFEVNAPVFRVEGCSFHMESHPRRYGAREYSDGMPDSQETNMIRKFAELAASGKPDPMWGEIALKTQQVLDACLQSAREGGRLVSVSA